MRNGLLAAAVIAFTVVTAAACSSSPASSDIKTDITQSAPSVPSPANWPQAIAGVCYLHGLGMSPADIEAALEAQETSATVKTIDAIVTYALARCPALIPAPVVTRTVTEKPSPAPKAAVTAKPTPVVAYAVYPSWSTAGQTVPPWLQPYTPHINGATQFTIVLCQEAQCTGYPGAGPDGSTCGPDHDNEQVCVR